MLDPLFPFYPRFLSWPQDQNLFLSWSYIPSWVSDVLFSKCELYFLFTYQILKTFLFFFFFLNLLTVVFLLPPDKSNSLSQSVPKTGLQTSFLMFRRVIMPIFFLHLSIKGYTYYFWHLFYLFITCQPFSNILCLNSYSESYIYMSILKAWGTSSFLALTT